MARHKVHLFCFDDEQKEIDKWMITEDFPFLPEWQVIHKGEAFDSIWGNYKEEDRFLLFCFGNAGYIGEFALTLMENRKVGAAIYVDGTRPIFTVTLAKPQIATVSLKPLDLACKQGMTSSRFYEWGLHVIFWYLDRDTDSFLSAADEIRRYRMGKQE